MEDILKLKKKDLVRIIEELTFYNLLLLAEVEVLRDIVKKQKKGKKLSKLKL